jgi:hypothetical protein
LKSQTPRLSPSRQSSSQLQLEQSQGDITSINKDQEQDLQRLVTYLQKQQLNWISEKQQIQQTVVALSQEVEYLSTSNMQFL